MAEFDMQKFCSGMNDVDRDLREMALFDLHRALKVPTFELPVADVKVVVQRVLSCFSRDEPDEEVRNNAVQVVPFLLFICDEEQQKLLSLSLCASCTPQTAQNGDRGYSDVVDSAAYALKLCCEAMSEKAREDVKMWQRLDLLSHTINDAILLALKSNTGDVVRDCMYDSINALINPFSRTYSCEVRDAMAEQALLDFNDARQLRRRVICCLSLLAPILSEASFNRLRETAFGGLRTGDSKLGSLPYVQLCESLVRSAPLRLVADAVDTTKSLLNEIAQRTEHQISHVDDEEIDYDLCDAMLQLVNCMVSQYPNELSTLHNAIFDQCVSLTSFDPNYCGDGWGTGDFDDYYVEMEEVDMSWKVRLWAARIISSSIQLSPISGKLVHRLNPENFCGVNDRVEEVQLASLQLVSVVVRHVKDVESPLLLLGSLDSLLRCLGDSSQKVCIAAARSLQLLFATHGSLLLREGDRVHSVLKKFLHGKTDEKIQLSCEIVALIQHVMDAALGSPANAPLRVKLFNDVFDALDTIKFAKLNNRFLRSMKTMANVAQIAGAPYAERCMSFLLTLLDTDALDEETSRAAVEALGHCFAILSPLLCEKLSVSCLKCLGSLAATNLSAVHVLSTLVAPPTMLQLQPDLLGQLCGYLGNDAYSYHHPVACIVRDAIRNGSKLTGEALPDVIEFSKLCSTKDVVREPLLLQATFQLLHEVCKSDLKISRKLFDEVLPVIWKPLHDLSASSSSLSVRIVESMASLLHIFFQKLPDKRSELVESTLRHISSSQFPEIDADLLGGIPFEDEKDLDNICSFLNHDDSVACLCAGTIGRHQPLSDTWKARIVSLLSNAETETARRRGLLAIGRATSNPGNVSLVPLIVGRAVMKTQERHVYWKAIKEATLASASQELSSFTDCALCKDVETRLIENVLEDDVETTAAVLGSFAPFNFDDLLDITLKYLNEESDSIKAACISTQRYLLSYCKGEKRKTRLDAAINVCLKYLERTSGIQTRFAALQLYATIASTTPRLLFSPKMRDVVYPNVLGELFEDPNLTLVIDLGNYTHREDKGIEIRKLAFECVSILLRDSERQGTGKILDYYGRGDELLRCLIHGCGRQEKGEVNETLNNLAKDLIVQLVKMCPNLFWSESAITTLCAKLKPTLNVEDGGPDVEKKKTASRHTLNCVMRLSECLPFTYASQFQPLLVLALRSPLLAESMISAL